MPHEHIGDRTDGIDPALDLAAHRKPLSMSPPK